MNVLEAFNAAWGALRSNRLRTSLTLLGMVIGVFAIIASVTAVKVIEVYFQESLSLLGSSTFSITRYPQINFGNGPEEYRRRITYDQVERLQENMSLPLTISPEEWFDMVAVRYGKRETEPNIIFGGSNENYPLNFGFDITEGRGISPQDVQYGRSVVMLGSAVAEALFLNETPLGKEIVIKGHRFQVIGVLSSKGSFLGFSWDNRVIAPITTMFYLYGGANRDIQSVSIRAGNPMEIPAAIEHVIGHMRVIRKIEPGKPNDFEITTNNELQNSFDAFTGVLTMAGAGIGFIALLAAGIGIMNIMLVSVTERTREIGIRKSVGAKRRDVMRQFLLEAFFLCQLGGLIGIVLGALFGNLTALYFDITAAFPVGWAFGGFGMVSAVALIFGVYPAFKAASLDPIESLRHE